MTLRPYLFFDGRCDEAIAFYRDSIGAEVPVLMRYREAPDPAMRTPATDDKVMHAELTIAGTTVMVSDGRCQGAPRFEGFSLSLMPADAAEAERLFNALAEGGEVRMPLAETFFSPRFGMLADRFGVPWMVVTTPPGEHR